MFAGRKLVIATKHKKEKVIGPILEQAFQINWHATAQLDTDQLGTFTGENERIDTALACARQKCLLAIAETGYDLAIASEGSFGPHPAMFFVSADEEIILLLDKKNGIEMVSHVLSTSTNYCGQQISTHDELQDFLTQAQFPSHAVIIRNAQHNFDSIVKGITDTDQLLSHFNNLLSAEGSVYMETDMRAMYNPTRMKVIEETTLLLVKKMNSLCPYCNFPGFEVTENAPGLPCSQCKLPTTSTRSAISSCKKCNYTVEKFFPKEKQFEDPTFCDYCNP